MQTVQTLVRRRDLRRLIRIYTLFVDLVDDVKFHYENKPIEIHVY